MFSNLTIANDNGANDNGPTHPDGLPMAHLSAQNLPSDVYAGGLIAVSGFSPVKPKVHITRSERLQSGSPAKEGHIPSGEIVRKKTSHKRLKKNGRSTVYFLFLFWLLALIFSAQSVSNNSGNTYSTLPLTLSVAGLGIMSLILTASAQKHRAKILHSLGISMASLCFAVLPWIYLQATGHSISPEILVMGLSGVGVIAARIWQSPYLLNVSILLGLGWSIYAFMAYHPSELAWLFPALWSAQMFLALEFRITRTVILSVVSGLVWIGVNFSGLNL